MKWADAPTSHETQSVFGLPDQPVVWRPPTDGIGEDGYPQIYPWRKCSYCGSIHPGDLVELAKTIEFCDAFEPYETKSAKPYMELADMKYGFPHKVYVETMITFRPDEEFKHGSRWSPAGVEPIMGKGFKPFIKFYTVHTNDQGIDDEAFAAIAKVMHDHAGIIIERDDQGVKWRGRPRMMKKNADNTPTFNTGERVKVAGQEGRVMSTAEDGRIQVIFDDSNVPTQMIEPDKVERT